MVNQRSSRQQIRRLRRHGVQPMTIVSPADALPRAAAVVLGQYLWRYRSELYPVGITILAGATAWMLHARSPYAWPAVACLAAVAPVAVILAGRKLGLTATGERFYGAAVA